MILQLHIKYPQNLSCILSSVKINEGFMEVLLSNKMLELEADHKLPVWDSTLLTENERSHKEVSSNSTK